MKKIGFIDHHLNNFHANKYIMLIREGQYKDQFDVTCAYGEAESGGVDSAQWCAERGVEMLSSPREVVEQSDHIIVLSPDNVERHLDLSRDALMSGKAIYIDKTFAPSRAVAQEMISLAHQYNTPMFSSSALRYVPEVHEFLNGTGKEHPARVASFRGPSSYEIYAVHVFEPMVMILGHGAEALMFNGDKDFAQVTVKYPDGRLGAFELFRLGHPFEASLQTDTEGLPLRFTTGTMFVDLVDSICAFFNGGPQPAPHEDTLEIMTLIETGWKAIAAPGTWVKVER
ncbi:MAG: Gfo/Idh/MocA family protein [Armatimonadota bacterium]